MKYLFLISFLSGCAARQVESSCPPLRQWSNVEQNNIEADLEQLPADSMLIPVVIDYERLRAEIRACRGEHDSK
jgi:hypothetical protein